MASETTQRRKRRLAKLATEPEQASSSKSARSIGTPDETELVKSLTKNSDDDLGLEKGGNIFRNHLLDLWAKNKQSAKTIHEIADLSQNAGARGVQKLAKVGASGKHPQNMARDLLRMALVNCTLPPLYWALIPCWNDTTSTCDDIWLPFLLPHELICALISSGSIGMAMLVNACTYAMKNLQDEVCNKLGKNKDTHIIFGLHGDGVPMQKNGQTVECFSLNFPFIPACERLLWGVLEKRFFCKCGCGGRHTLDPIFELFVWMMRLCDLGSWPSGRHDKRAWLTSDRWRSKLQGLFGWTGSLAQVRGDWSWYKAAFSFGGWCAKEICWLCGATQRDGAAPFTEVDSKARWRRTRYLSGQFLKKMRDMGVAISPLLKCPGMKLAYITIDTLHALDLGFALDVLGNFFWALVSEKGILDGSTIDTRVTSLWAWIKKVYKAQNTQCRVQALTRDMILSRSKSNAKPKLRAKGGESRHLVPVALAIANEIVESHNTAFWITVAQLLSHLFDFYMALGVTPFQAETVAKACRACCTLYKALSDQSENPKLWAMKPKIHMFQELAEYMASELGNPADYWCYRDESFVGFVAAVAMSRGGGRATATMSENVLQKFRALSSL